MTTKERFENLRAIHGAEARIAYLLEVFGFELAKREGYKDLDGMDAVHLYLIRKYHWLPRDVRSMSYKDIELVLTVELQEWSMPQAARDQLASS